MVSIQFHICAMKSELEYLRLYIAVIFLGLSIKKVLKVGSFGRTPL